MESNPSGQVQALAPKQNPKPDQKVLMHFDTYRKSIQIPPKKEYIRCKLIRGHKRAIRQIISNQLPKATIHKFDPEDSKAHSLWMMMRQIYIINQSEFDSICKTESGPATDGRSKRDGESVKASEKSFNSSFCKSYFYSKNVRDSFAVYLDLIFSNFDPKVLSEKFEFFCCRCELHSVDCMEKWLDLMEYLRSDMLIEVGCEAVESWNMIVSFPKFENFEEFSGLWVEDE
jgi:hypothetical protein